MRSAAVATLVLALALPAEGAVPRRAALTLQSTAPLVVLGRDFGMREPVVVTYVGEEPSERKLRVQAGRTGAFRAVFALRVDRCAAFTVRAAGRDGSRAVLQAEPGCERRKGRPKRAA